jgi:hypothetical protein
MARKMHVTQLVCNDLERVATLRASSPLAMEVVPDVLAHEDDGFLGKIAESFHSLHEPALRDEVPIVRYEIDAVGKAMLYCQECIEDAKKIAKPASIDCRSIADFR